MLSVPSAIALLVLVLNFATFQHNNELSFPGLNQECSFYSLVSNPVIQVLRIQACFFFLHVKTFYSGE